MIHQLIHLCDNSHGNIAHHGGQWHRYLDDQVRPALDQFGVRHVLCRQPFPTPSTHPRDPLWFTGYTRAKRAGNHGLWATFVPAVESLRRSHAIQWWSYLGHLGGDTNPPGVPQDRVPWNPDPLLAETVADPNRFRWLIDDNLTPHDHVGANVIFDASARMDANTPYFHAIEQFRLTATAAGRLVGVESPAHPECPHLDPYLPVMTWRYSQSDHGRSFIGRDHVVFLESADALELSRRANAVIRNGGRAVLFFLYVQRAGFRSLEEWLAQ